VQQPPPELWFTAFGLRIRSDFMLPGATAVPPPPGRDLVLRLVDREDLRPTDGDARHRGWNSFDGARYDWYEHGDGTLSFHYGERAWFELSAEGSELRCAAADESEPTWQRVLLDTVLFSVSQLRGLELLHCSSVLLGGRLVSFVAHSGNGKSSLAGELVRRGATLFADDILAFEQTGAGGIVAHPGPALMNVSTNPVGASADDLGTIIATIGDEHWTLVQRRGEVAPMAPSAIVLLERHAGATRCSCVPVPASSLALLPHSVVLPGLEHDHAPRFEAFASLAETISLLRLEAPPSDSPAALADATTAALAADRGSGA
jgi:hypothetical protein